MKKNMPTSNSRATAAPIPAPTPAAKWLFGFGTGEGEAEGELVGKTVGEVEVDDTTGPEVVVVAPVAPETLEVITAVLAVEFGRIVEEVIAASEKIRDEVWQQSARE